MKIKRNYEFVLTSCSREMAQESTGEVMFKSECHYYCEKEIVSCLKEAAKRNALAEYYPFVYRIYKVTKPAQEKIDNLDGSYTVRELPRQWDLVETITVNDETVTIQ